MEQEEGFEKPISRVLFRQTSYETRLSPVHLSQESLNDSDNDESESAPKIVNYQIKKVPENVTKTPPPSRKGSAESTDECRMMLQKELEQKLKQSLGANANKNKITVKKKYTVVDNDIADTEPENEMIYNPFVSQLKSGLQRDSCAFNTNEIIDPITTMVGRIKGFSVSERFKPVEEDEERVGGPKREDMATLRPKSPRPVVNKNDKDESIWEKIGTLGRKKRIKEVQDVQAEGKYAIDSPGHPTAPAIPPEEYNLNDNEERCMLDQKAYGDPKFQDLTSVLIEWINDELASQRIIVRDLAEDLYDGQVLQKLLEKLTGDKMDVPEVTQSEEGQKQKLNGVLRHFNQILGVQHSEHNKWSVEAIHSKNIVPIIHLLVALARHFRPPVRLPEHVTVDVVVVQKYKGMLSHKTVRENLTTTYDDVGMRCERDAFDTLFDHAPDKLQVVKKSLVTFVNKHLNKMNFEVSELETQFHDGVYLIMLMGLLEGFFVPHYSFHLTPHEFEQKVHNVNFAFELMEEVGLQKPKARPEDIVNMDLKSTLRVLYKLFLNYKTLL